MNYILFDGKVRNNLLPLTYTRPVADIRVGILTIREKWEKLLGEKTSTLTKSYLQEKYPLVNKKEDILINASFLPNLELIDIVKGLEIDQAVYYQGEIVAAHIHDEQHELHGSQYSRIEYEGSLLQIENVWDIFSLNKEAIQADFELLTKNKISQALPEYVHTKNPENIFLESGAEIEECSLNASDGPIYIGKNATIMEGSMIRGSFALCEGSTVKMGAKIYGGTTVGPQSKVGGELNNVVIFGFTNKAHDGFLGNAVIGAWCNLGADTNNSNLKNNYAPVKLWSYEKEGFAQTGLQFCGLIMGDHSKCGINTMFNTGTLVGVSANIFGDGFPRNFIPSFSWGGPAGYQVYKMNKVKEVAKVVMERRGVDFDATEENILNEVFKLTEKYRNF